MRALVFIAAISGAAWAHAATPDFTPGRPGATESAISVPAGHLQIETEIASYAKDSEDGAEATRWSAAATSFRYGLAHGIDAELIVAPYLRESVEAGGAKAVARGAGDVTVRVRRTFMGQDGDGPSLGVIGYVTLPTAADGLGADEAEGGALLAGGFDLDDRWNLAWTVGAAAVSAAGGGRQGEYSGALTLGRAIGARWGAFGEVAVSKADEDREAAATFDIGVTLLTDDVTQLDAGANFGFTGAADDLTLFLGWAHRF
jgi:hypothetical protein